MKFNFKIQPFQTEATARIMRGFEGAPKQERFRGGYGIGALPVTPEKTAAAAKKDNR